MKRHRLRIFRSERAENRELRMGKSIPNGGFGVRDQTYDCLFDWDCFVQCGNKGIVFSNPAYFTAFFEAFPRNPDTFIRGEGNTVEEAEKSAWSMLQKFKACSGHEFERRGYTNGAGFCIHCGMFNSKAFDPTTICCKCSKPTDYTQDKDRNYYCENCQKLKTPDKFTEVDWVIVRSEHYRHTVVEQWLSR